MWIDILLAAAIILAGLKALRARRLLPAVLWLALSSALVASALFRAGAPEVAVIELSVGAGLVTVLFVFSIAIAGEDAMNAPALVPPALAWLLIVAAAVLLAWPLAPIEPLETAAAEPSFSTMLWQERGLDVLVQIGLIFAGVLGILGLLAEPASLPAAFPAAESGKHTAAVRPRPIFTTADSLSAALHTAAPQPEAPAPVLEETR
jgi:uncharacterized MnhB-related membrane protein